jgi:hypothetical protein
MYILLFIIIFKCIGWIINEREQQIRHKKFIKNFNNYENKKRQNKRGDTKS